MGKFLSCDWGTSSFRLRLVETPGLNIMNEKISAEGIAQTFELWKQSGNTEDARFSFYLELIQKHIQDFEKTLGFSLTPTPLVISGMAGSSMGMIELPYKEFPFAIDGSDLITKSIQDKKSHDVILIISGAKTNDDVIRGEETQLAGCPHEHNAIAKELFILPGTHSKHIIAEGNRALSCKTYMTGEFFQLLSTKSILSNSVEKASGVNMRAFKNGIEDGAALNLLLSSFQVRTNLLFNKYTKGENYWYLSGVLIGTELKELSREPHEKIILITSRSLRSYYETALNVLHKDEGLEIHDADEALVRGQFKVLQRLQ